MIELTKITDYMEKLFPTEIAEDFDNVGLLVGRRHKEISKILVCLDCHKNVVREAALWGAQLIISHHPVIFNPIKKICDDSDAGEMLISALENNISIYSAHTNLDSARGGLTDELCTMLGIEPFSDLKNNVGRVCHAPNGETAKSLCEKIKKVFNIDHLYSTFEYDRNIKTVAICNGGGSSLTEAAVLSGADVFITGDLKHHQMMELSVMDNMDFIEIRHYDSEIAMCKLVTQKLQSKFGSDNDVEIKISAAQHSPIIDTDNIL